MDSSPLPRGELKLEATQSIHGDFLEKAVPQWLVDATPARRSALKAVPPALPQWYKDATPAQRNTLNASVKASAVAQVQLDKTMATFKNIDAFAKPLLLEALKDQYQVEVDVEKTCLCLRRPLEISIAQVELGSFELLKLSMLQAALHNFEAWECKPGAYHKSSGFVLETATPGTYEPVILGLSVSQFTTLCRSLDIGAQYQTYLKAFFAPVDSSPAPALRQHFIASQKATMKAAADHAVLTGDIEPADHAMIVSMVNGTLYLTIGNKRVWPYDMSLMGKRLVGCIYFVIGDRYAEELILYIPHDPAHPLKRYSSRQQMCDTLKRLFTAREGMTAVDPTPTAYQKFFSQFMPYDQQPYYFSQFTQKSADSPSGPLTSPWRTFVEFALGLSPITSIKELPPEKPAKMEPVSDPYIAPGNLMPYRGTGTFSGLLDIWPFQYEKHRDKVLADARAHAVPTADVDAKARETKLAHLMEIGMLALNLVSMFVPGLGEIMMTVMVEQLLSETLEGSIEWAEGNKRAAKAHLVDVAENLAQIAVMAGVGVAVGKFRAVKPEPVIESLSPVTLPNGETRLWKPDLSAYESSISLDAGPAPDALGQHLIDGKSYIRQDGKVYEHYFDESIAKWRIKHPTDAGAYQPILESNGLGAWRHTLERPLEWDRLTLLRRMGHVTEEFSDTELIKVADVSGVSDNALRKMHMDHAAPLPELADAMRMFKADSAAGEVLEQLQGHQPIDERYLFALPLVAEMPRWPRGKVLEVFKGQSLTGESVKYGSERVRPGAPSKPTVKVSRRDVLSGELAARILASLDESEVTRLLGSEPARVRESRPQEFNKQIAEYAMTRKPAIFDSIYTGTEPVDARIRQLQRTCPGLSEAAAQDVLAHARAQELKQMEQTRRVPLSMLEEARWYARQGRQVRAYAGLRSDAIASADSRRLALHTLEQLPGWPDTLRLEVREGSPSGALLDSIGGDSAPDKKYLVKSGPRYQAFNERGEALNSVPRDGDNYYASLMHALPDQARQRLGVPNVSQSADLRGKIIRHADRYREQAARILEPQAKGFKPPARVNGKLVGYYASGRGQGLDLSLNGRVRDLYPDLTDEQASHFVRQLRQGGRNDKQIFNLLQNREREYRDLERALDQWVGPRTAPNPFTASPSHSLRAYAVQTLKDSWRSSPLAGEVTDAAKLRIVVDAPLPALAADFSHIRELSVEGIGINDANADGFLAQFPNVEKLYLGDSVHMRAITLDAPLLTSVPQAVKTMTALKSLKFEASNVVSWAQFSSGLSELTALEELHLISNSYNPTAFQEADLSALTRLKSLTIDAPQALLQWPAYVQKLTQLERLDLANTGISALPDALYTGHEKIWAGLSLNWARFSREHFKPAYDYVSAYSGPMGHLADLNQMVTQYSQGELGSLFGGNAERGALHQKIMATWHTPETRFAAVEALSEEYRRLFGQFASVMPGGVRFRLRLPEWQLGQNALVINALENSWRGAVAQRYGLPAQVSVFDLPGLVDSMGARNAKTVTLPQLPAGSFSHVTTLRLGWVGETIEQTRGFIRAFSATQSLEISGHGLTEVPVGSADLPALTRLDLSHNRIVMTPAVQTQLNGLTGVEYLNLRANPLEQLDISALTQLKALDLQGSTLKAWPTGAEGLTQLSWLDLRHNAIPTLPQQALAEDELLLKLNLTGNRFSPAGEKNLKAAHERIERARGLPEGALARFAAETVPAQFPPEETGASIARYLLPMPAPAIALEGAAGFAPRLQQLNSAMPHEQALARIEQLRGDGMDDLQIDAQLSQWHQASESLTRQLNGWLYIREFNTASPTIGVSAESRWSAAHNIRECWQDGVAGGTNPQLSLQGAQTGDLPELAVQLPHVRTLDLTGVRLTAQGSNAFFNAFTQLTRLILGGNELTALPEAVEHMGQLERLELTANSFSDAGPLYRQLGGEHLRWLDLSHNSLEEFNTEAFSRLETLNLAYNNMEVWPFGVLESAHLRSLDLSGNGLRNLPDRLLGGSHDGLVAGTDLSDNHQLPLNALHQLRDYSEAHADGGVMGVSRAEIDRRIAALESDSDADSGSGGDSDSDGDSDDDLGGGYQPLEIILDAQGETGEEALASWLMNTPQALAASRRQMWLQLTQEPGHGPFFHLLSQLRDTHEYRFTRADLTRRVWNVIEAATESAQQREPLFVASQTHDTCIDGRTLTFSAMEVLVFEEQVLRDIPTHDLRLKGQRLLNLSRQLFRLDRVDTLAEANARNMDRAEVRLQYRIGMTRGWPDGLELPGQPSHMAFATPISGQTLIEARAGVLAAEASDAFYESLIARDYWLSYLRQRYPEAFDALEQNAVSRQDALEEEHSARQPGTESQERYEEALIMLEIELGSARAQKLLELSRQEVQQLSAELTPTSPQPGPSRRM
ncbi:leucine-rich repeat-containing protein [Pseudomonas libanensis]|uniref:RING-type E3 ubiquitin transferase n=1 Tax=Pseudomonas libanensis TaxID=75588 RepID=A0A0R2YNL3_9PSED|nr:leucine-rich repeat-containing protein [Pseudomonas libanensis]